MDFLQKFTSRNLKGQIEVNAIFFHFCNFKLWGPDGTDILYFGVQKGEFGGFEKRHFFQKNRIMTEAWS